MSGPEHIGLVMIRAIVCVLINAVLQTPDLTAKAEEPYHILLKGKVADSAGRGVPGVSVTDGTSIVRTNSKGHYELESTGDAEFVYITVPSGFEIPVHNGLARFYQRIIHKDKHVKADFTLKKMERDDSRHYIVLWADPQINDAEQAAQMHRTAVPDTRGHILELQNRAPVYGIAAGDIAWDAPGIIPEYKKVVHEMGIPFFQVLGNHDMNINVRSDEQSDELFRNEMGPTWYSFDRGLAHYVVLDNVFYYSNGYNYIGYITEKQLRWLEQDLSYVKPGSPVFVSMHISAYTEEKRRENAGSDNPGNVTFNRKFLYEMLKPFKAHLLTGHTHYNENRIEDGVYEHIHAAVCGSWWTTPVCTDGTPAGYGVYQITGDSVSWYYKSIGFSPDYQMRAYNRSAYEERPSEVAVNVWNWDEGWKVAWYEDGIFKGEMKQETCYDARATELMKGPDRPGVYSWIDPGLTDHIFFAAPSTSAREVRIEVTDRFGNIYYEELELK